MKYYNINNKSIRLILSKILLEYNKLTIPYIFKKVTSTNFLRNKINLRWI